MSLTSHSKSLTAIFLKPHLINILFLFLIFSCSPSKDKKNNLSFTSNDTSEVFRIFLDSAFKQHRLIDIKQLYRDNPFGDSIIFEKYLSFDIKKYLASYNSLKFKELRRTEICDYATQLYDPIIEHKRFPHFLSLKRFICVDSIYEIALENICVFPNYYKDGKKYKGIPRVDFADSCKCTYGFLCGGGLRLKIHKSRDGSYKTISIHGWAD